MFGNESLPAKIYNYGARPPTLNSELVGLQIHLAHRYRNVLCAIERRRRVHANAALRQWWPALVELDAAVAAALAELDAARQAIRAASAAARSKAAVTPDARRRATDAAATLKALRARHKEARTAAWADPRLVADLADADADAVAWGKLAYRAIGNMGLSWGTRLTVQQAAQKFRKGAPPKFRRFDGGGKVAVQLQKGLSVGGVFTCEDTRLRVAPPACAGGERWGRRGACRTVANVRVGTAPDGRSPVWCDVPFTMHRPLPDDGRVKWAYLVRRRIATREEWLLQFVVERRGGFPRPDAARSGTVAIDVGWRLTDAGLRVAYWVGDDGAEGELVLPHAGVARWAKSESLRSIRDRDFNAARDALAAWLAGREVPAWLGERSSRLTTWRAPARLASLCLHWHGSRFDGDGAAFDAMEAWRKQDKHLYLWERSNLAKATAWRENLYRNFAATLRRRYAKAIVEDTDWRRLQKMPEAEEESRPGGVRTYMRVAAVGRLLEILRESMATESVPAAYSTMTCPACRGLSGEPNPANLYHVCQWCSHVFDQDRAAALNLLSGTRASAASAPVVTG